MLLHICTYLYIYFYLYSPLFTSSCMVAAMWLLRNHASLSILLLCTIECNKNNSDSDSLQRKSPSPTRRHPRSSTRATPPSWCVMSSAPRPPRCSGSTKAPASSRRKTVRSLLAAQCSLLAAACRCRRLSSSSDPAPSVVCSLLFVVYMPVIPPHSSAGGAGTSRITVGFGEEPQM